MGDGGHVDGNLLSKPLCNNVARLSQKRFSGSSPHRTIMRCPRRAVSSHRRCSEADDNGLLRSRLDDKRGKTCHFSRLRVSRFKRAAFSLVLTPEGPSASAPGDTNALTRCDLRRGAAVEPGEQNVGVYSTSTTRIRATSSPFDAPRLRPIEPLQSEGREK